MFFNVLSSQGCVENGLILNQLYVFLQRGKYGIPNLPEMGNKTTKSKKSSSAL